MATQHYCELSLYSTHLTNQAKSILNCNTSRKSFDAVLPECIDDEYLPSLIRGIYEGDGCWQFGVQKQKNNDSFRVSLVLVSASSMLLDQVRVVIDNHCLNTSKRIGRIYKCSGGGNSHRLIYGAQEYCQVIGNCMYPTCVISEEIIMRQKYQRHILFNRLFSDSVEPRDRARFEEEFVNYEKEQSYKTLMNLKAMTDQNVECPVHFKFRKSFCQNF